MPRATWSQNNFNGGEWSPLAYGRADHPKYKYALATCLNYVPTPQGGLTRRPGTKFIATVKNSANAVRLYPFEFSTTQAYVLEFGPSYVRFYTNEGQLIHSGTAAYATATITVTIASPGVVTWNAHGFSNGDTVAFTTTGALPTGLAANTAYYVINATTNTFQLSATAGGTAINTSGSQSGTHTGYKSYAAGSAVSYSGTIYVCIATSVANLPTNTTYWYAQTTTGGVTPFELPTPYGASDLSGLAFVQSANVLYIAHNNYAPRTLNRTGALSWSLSTLAVTDGPYLLLNTTTTTLTSSVAGPGSATVTASSVAGINGGSGFLSTDVGRVIRLKSGTNWGWGTITAVASTTSATVNWTTAVGTTASANWRLGVWNSANGYPGAVAFHQDRLTFGGVPNFPNRIDSSNGGDYTNFSPTGVDGTVVDTNALSFNLASAKMNVINWIVSDEWGMLVGTSSNEWVIAASTTQVALTPTNINAKQSTAYGSNGVYPARMGKSTLFVQRTGRKIREMTYQLMMNSFQAADISLLAEHLTKGGIKQLAAQNTPNPVLWVVRNDGTLVGISYEKDQEIVGWHQHQFGGYSDAAQTLPPVIESVAVIPSPTTIRDDLWVCVQRYVNGAVVRTVELLNKYWEDGDAISDAFFVDCGATYSGSSTTTVSGLTWLKGQTVSVLADGSVHPDCVVNSSGVITLSRSATKVQVGLGYNSDGRTMRIEAGGADGTAQGKLKRIHRAIFRIFQSVGLKVAATSASTYPEPFRSSADKMDNPVALYTGDKRWAWDGSYELEGQIFWRQSDPLPSNVLMVVAQLETQDGG